MDAELEQQVRAFAIGRIGLGAAAIVAPGPVLKRWLGKGQYGPGSRVLARFVGGRDVALGLGTLFALSHGAPVRGWIEAGMVADAGDLVATLVGARDLPKVSSIGTALAAAGGVAYARRLVNQLQEQSTVPVPPSEPPMSEPPTPRPDPVP